jgi:hypothetical protein
MLEQSHYARQSVQCFILFCFVVCNTKICNPNTIEYLCRVNKGSKTQHIWLKKYGGRENVDDEI